MSFNFGATSTPAKPTGFGQSTFNFGNTSGFGQPATTSAPSLFGGSATNTFGQPATGINTFGQPATGINTLGGPPAGNSTFGVQPTGNSTFGAQPIGTNTFGAQPSGTNTFGAQPSGTNAFGIQTGGASTFGVQPTGTTGFGTQPATSGFGQSMFGQTNTTSTPSLFGGSNTFGQTSNFAQPNTGLGQGFGTFGAKTTSSLFPTFGQTTTTQSGFGGFGTNTAFGTGSTFGQPFPTLGQQQQQQQQQPQSIAPQLSADEAFLNTVINVSIFGDERDATIAKWNHLQAIWGTGKAFYSQSQQPAEIDQQNILSRFKTMGYSKINGKDNKSGMIALNINKPIAQVKEQQQQIISTLHSVFGNKPNLSVFIDCTKPLSDSKSQLIFFIEEKSQTNETRKIAANEVYSYLNSQSMAKQQLTNLGVENIFPFVAPDEDQLKEYLENPPKGIDQRMWKQAKEDNPDSKKFIPVPMIGFNDLKWRIKCQENETESHVMYLQKVDKDLSTLKQRHANTSAKIMEHRRKLAELSHRVLKIIVKQETTRKMGVGMSAEEEMIRSKLENMHTIVSAPTQFKGRLSELLSQTRMQRNQWRLAGSINEYTLDKEGQEEMKSFLTMQQKAMTYLIETVNKDLKDLKTIQDGMSILLKS